MNVLAKHLANSSNLHATFRNLCKDDLYRDVLKELQSTVPLADFGTCYRKTVDRNIDSRWQLDLIIVNPGQSVKWQDYGLTARSSLLLAGTITELVQKRDYLVLKKYVHNPVTPVNCPSSDTVQHYMVNADPMPAYLLNLYTRIQP